MKLFESKTEQKRLTEAFDLNGLMLGAEADEIVAMLNKEISKIPNIKDHYIQIDRTRLSDGDKYLAHYGGNDVFVTFAKEKDPKAWAYGYVSNDPAVVSLIINFNKGKAVVKSHQQPSWNPHQVAGTGAFRNVSGSVEQVVKAITKYIALVMKNIDKYPNNK